MSDTFTCEMCGGTFEKGRSDDEALADMEAKFGEGAVPPVIRMIVCDDCARKIDAERHHTTFCYHCRKLTEFVHHAVGGPERWECTECDTPVYKNEPDAADFRWLNEMNDVEFLFYVDTHSQTERHLFSREHIERLAKLAGVSLMPSIFSEPNPNDPPGFFPLRHVVAHAFVEQARRQLRSHE